MLCHTMHMGTAYNMHLAPAAYHDHMHRSCYEERHDHRIYLCSIGMIYRLCAHVC